jgi:hypothetical protein
MSRWVEDLERTYDCGLSSQRRPVITDCLLAQLSTDD